MPGQPVLQRPMRGQLLRQLGVALDRFLDLQRSFGSQFAIGIGGDIFARDGHAFSPSSVSSASRPRTSRELSVPTGQPTISAASR